MWRNKRGFQLVLPCWTPARNLCKAGMPSSRCHGGGHRGHLVVQEGRMSPVSPAHIVASALEQHCHCSEWFSPEFYQGKAKSLFLKPGNSSLVFIPADLGHAGKQPRAGGAGARGAPSWDRASPPALPLSPRQETPCIYRELHGAGKGPRSPKSSALTHLPRATHGNKGGFQAFEKLERKTFAFKLSLLQKGVREGKRSSCVHSW